MRHRNAFRKLGRNPSHRRALFRNLATALVLNNRVETTVEKAKELRRIADKLVTLGKRNTLHTRRQALSYLTPISREVKNSRTKLTAVHLLFDEIAPRYQERNGGYTRVVRTRKRDGDKAQMAIIEFVEAELKEKVEARPKRKTRRTAKKETAAVEETTTAEEVVSQDEETSDEAA